MTTAWSPVGTTITSTRWWAAVVAGGLAPVLVTPLGDLLDPWVRVSLIGALVVVAVVCGLPPTFRRAVEEARSVAPSAGAALLAAACVVAVATAVPVVLYAGMLQGLVAVGLATAVHLVAARLTAGVLRAVPGAAEPGVLPLSGGTGASFVDRIDRVLPRLPLVVGALAALSVVVWFVLGGLPGAVDGVRTCIAVLLVASPAAFLVARFVPTRAARDRGRELGIHYWDVDLLRLARTTSLAMDPMTVVAEPQPRLVAVHTLGRLQVTAALQAAASVAAGSADPAHVALVSAARDRAIPLRRTEPVPGDGAPPVGTLRRSIKGAVVTVGHADAFDVVPAQLVERGSTVFVGWGGAARAGFELVPVVQSSVLADWPDLLAMPIRSVFVSDDAAALRHVGAAMEVHPVDLRELPRRGDVGPHPGWGAIVEDLRADGPVAVVGDHDLPDTQDVVVMKPGTPATEEGPLPPSPTTMRLVDGDLAGAVRALGLARKTSRVTMQGLTLVSVVHVVGLTLAVAGLLDAGIAAVVGAGLPLLAALNALRPRSFARELPAT